jgi:aminoglycoside phosphotransferase (APT) family kinase protein
MSDDDAGLRAALGTWLRERIDGADEVRVDALGSPKSGYSAETFMVDARVVGPRGERPERFVLRRETPEPPIYPVQAPGTDLEIAVQYRAMEAVAGASSVPVAPLLGFEHDASVLGAPFFVMGFVPGEVPVENPIYTREGFFADAGPDERARMLDDGVRVLAEIHRIDWQAAGLGWLSPAGTTPGTERQLDLWAAYARRELGERTHPLLDRAMAWLRENLPPLRPVGLSWGDPRPGNMIWRDFRCVCVTDFEAVSIAPPEHDLGWWLMFDRWSHETMGAPRLPGEPTRAEQRDRYAAHLGRDVGDTLFDEVFAAARYAAIVVRVMNRMVERGLLPADQTIWLDNPATVCLADLLPD